MEEKSRGSKTAIDDFTEKLDEATSRELMRCPQFLAEELQVHSEHHSRQIEEATEGSAVLSFKVEHLLIIGA